MNNRFLLESEDIAWCPGCGNFNIRNIISMALEQSGLSPENTVICSGIGQAAKMPQYINANMFNGLHGRSVPVATAVKSVNPDLAVFAEGGDGDMYGEGGNHLIHAIRRNPDIVNIVHDNMIYGLTKGQASPTSPEGLKTPLQVNGVTNEPINPMALAISLNASFVARIFSGDVEYSVEILKKAISHRGYALIDVLHPCVSFNHVNTFQWYKKHTYHLEKHDRFDQAAAFKIAMEKEKLALGVLYENNDRKTFEENRLVYQNNPTPLARRKPLLNAVAEYLKERKL